MAEVGRLEILLEAKVDRLMSALDRARGEVGRTSRDMERELQRQRDSFGRAGEAVGRWGARVSLAAGAALAAIVAYSTRAAANAAETANAFQVAFGRQTEAAQRFATTYSRQVGRALTDVQSNMSRTQLVLTGVGVNAETALAATEAVARRAVDLGSLWNVDDAEAFRAVLSGISGEAEPLKRFGVALNQTALNAELLRLGFRGNAQDAPEAAKAIARLNIILRATQSAQGDAITTAGSLANQQRRLQSQFQDSAVAFGQQFLPVANRVTHWAVEALTAFNNLPSGVQNAGLAMLALVAAGGPIAAVVGGLRQLIGWANAARIALATVGTGAAAPIAGGASGLALGAAVGGPVGLILGGAAVALSPNPPVDTMRRVLANPRQANDADLATALATARQFQAQGIRDRANPTARERQMFDVAALEAEATRRQGARPAGGAPAATGVPQFTLPPELLNPNGGNGGGGSGGSGRARAAAEAGAVHLMSQEIATLADALNDPSIEARLRAQAAAQLLETDPTIAFADVWDDPRVAEAVRVRLADLVAAQRGLAGGVRDVQQSVDLRPGPGETAPAQAAEANRVAFRDAFREGIVAALHGDLKDLVINAFASWTTDALEQSLNRMADMLFDAVFSQGSGGGGGVFSAFASAVSGFSSAPKFAAGTSSAPGGLAYVHRDELINLPQGSQVIPSHALRAAAAMSGSVGYSPAFVVQGLHFHAEGAVMTAELLGQMQALADQSRQVGAMQAVAQVRRAQAQRAARFTGV